MTAKASRKAPSPLISSALPISFRKLPFSFTIKQKKLLKLAQNTNTRVVFVSGPAGTAKTLTAVYAALQFLKKHRDAELLYVRSVIESGEKGMGALPGTINEKFDPFLMPLEDKLYELLESGDVSSLKMTKRVQATPINFLRGADWKDKFVVADEAQNFTHKELVTLLTRLSAGTKLLICGDPMQSDLNGRSGFANMIQRFDDEECRSRGIGVFEFTGDDIVRDPLLSFMIKRLEKTSL